ncbi:MAG TPA: hypothetical protein VGR93_08035 [Candidatus Acidoferrales bacterium]|nr:hypothetical protein [Candidatus Acidoferrales bacterium]
MKSDRRQKQTRLTRREWIKAAASVAAGALVPSDALKAWSASPVALHSSTPAQPESYPREWTGHNRKLGEYHLEAGYPAYAPHPRYIGELRGTWAQMGKQYGERAGDLIRMVYEGWYRELLPIQGNPQVMAAYLRQQEAYYETLVPEALEMMHGIADGAAAELASSAFPRELSHFDKILMINSYFGLMGKPPVSQTAELVSGDEEVHCCSGAVMLAGATRDGKTIHVSSEDQHFFPQEYLVTFIAQPSDRRAHRFTVTDSAGEIGSEHAQNERGVTVSGYAGGGIGILGPTLARPFSGYRRPGLDWQVGDFYAAAFANDARHAVELLTVGRPEYRAKSGRKIVIGKCTFGANWVISDSDHAFVVESIPADEQGQARYAVRVPGDMDEKNARYIASTNNVEAKDSYNEENVHDPVHAMSQHGNSTQRATYFGLNGSGMRFWTFMQLMEKHYGEITVEMVQDWRKTHFVYDRAGVQHDHVEVDGRPVPIFLEPRAASLCRHTSGPAGVDTLKGINIYVSLSVAQDLVSFRAKGRPCEWIGPWDRVSLRELPSVDRA